MAEEKTVGQSDVKKAKEGEMIQVIKGEQKGKTGEVLMVRDNSVIIKVGTKPQTDEPIKVVVNHKNYKRIK
jgi:uncharacterized protein YkvS